MPSYNPRNVPKQPLPDDGQFFHEANTRPPPPTNYQRGTFSRSGYHPHATVPTADITESDDHYLPSDGANIGRGGVIRRGGNIRRKPRRDPHNQRQLRISKNPM